MVVDTSSGRDAAAIARGHRRPSAARATGTDGQLRMTRTPTEQLSVTSYFAARGYAVVGVGLDRARRRRARSPSATPPRGFALTDARGAPRRGRATAALSRRAAGGE